MNRKKAFLTVFVVAIMVAGMLFIVPLTSSTGTANHPSNLGKTVSNSLSSHPVNASNLKGSSSFNRQTEAMKLIGLAKNDSLPIKDLFIPNFMSQSKIVNGVVTPGYGQSPAPMGIGFYGLYNQSGTTVGQNYTFPSVAAHVNLSSLQTINIADDAPQTVTFQLNSILNNVNLFGNGNYVFWTQNVVDYSARTHQLSFVLNIWNFTTPAATSQPVLNNVLYSSSAPRISYPNAIIILGPSLQLPSSQLNLYLYMNTSIVGGRQALWFNYSLPQLKMNGTYEEAVFNSTINAAPLHYLVSGTTMTPTGYIPYDSEIMIGGPGGGSTATVQNISGSMNLMYYNTTMHMFMNVPNAYDIGSETGETSTGVDVHYLGSTAYLTSGPSMVYGLWNETNSTVNHYTGKLSNSNAFLFVAQNTKDANLGFWNWAPINGSGTFSYYLPKSAGYPYEALMNYHNINGGNKTYLNVTTSTVINLESNVNIGVYTPIIINGNKQLTESAVSGAGSAANPYVIDAYSANGINTIFAQLNDYAFPVFPGVFIYNTNYHVKVSNFHMNVTYSGFAGLLSNFYGLLNSNNLPMWVYNSTNVTISGGVFETWYSSNQNGYIEGSMVLWNSTNINVTGIQMIPFGYGALIYNPQYQYGNISFYSDLFVGASLQYKLNLTNPFWSNYLEGSSQIGMTLSGTGYFVNGSTFVTETPVISYDCNIYTGNHSVPYKDYFNGNEYWNYNGTGAYNDYGMMQVGVDMHPMIPTHSSKFTVSVLDNPSDSYYFDVGYLEITLGQASNVYQFTSGSFYIYNPTTYKMYAVSSDNFVYVKTGIMQLNSTKPFSINPSISTLNVMESGLPSGMAWTANIYNYENITLLKDGSSMIQTENGVPLYSITSKMGSISFTNIAPGYYYVTVNSTDSYGVAGSSMVGFMAIEGTTNVSVQFVHVNLYNVTFKENGLMSGTEWSVIFNGMKMTSTSGSITFTGLYAGNYSYYVSVPSGYSLPKTSGYVNVNSNETLYENYSMTNIYSVTFKESGLASGTSWYVIFNGMKMTSTSGSITFSNLSAGSYYYFIGVPSGYSLSTNSGTVNVNSSMTMTESFSMNMYTIEFHETGLVSGTNWTVMVNGKVYNSTTQDINVTVPYGMVSYAVGNVSGYISTDSSGMFNASGNAVVNVLFGVQSTYSDLTYITIGIAALTGLVAGVVIITIFRKK